MKFLVTEEELYPPSPRAASNQSLTGKYLGFGNDPIVVVGIGNHAIEQSFLLTRQAQNKGHINRKFHFKYLSVSRRNTKPMYTRLIIMSNSYGKTHETKKL